MRTLFKTLDEPAKGLSNETLTTIYERRAVRRYKDKAVSKDLIEQLLDAGRMAPSAINRQPWKFYVLTNKEDIKIYSKEIAAAAIKGILAGAVKKGIFGFIKTNWNMIIKTGRDLLHFSHGADFLKAENAIFHGAPVVIFITSPKDNEWAQLDVGMCAQNIMLAAKSMGLDSCPVGLAKFVEQTKIYVKLNVPESDQINLAIILGYGNENPEPKERVRGNAFFVY
jgi:nitroreductase